ncbi:MAG: GNAT family N-acetyltransferase [Bacillota bacterium]
MQIRQADQADEKGVCDLWKMLLHFYGKERSEAVFRRSFRYAVSRPGQIQIFVAVMEEKIVGTASLHLGHYSTWNDHWYGHVEDVIVVPACRGRGVGEALIRRIIAAAAELGLGRLELNALADNTAARKMYEKIGFKTDSVSYELPLG